MRAAKFGEGFGGFVEEIVWSDIAGEEQDNLETNLVDLERALFGEKLRMRAAKFGDEFGGFVEEIVWSDIVGEEQDNLEKDLVDL
jgi:iron uptake system EfeUOB component EfeO/EfeM